MPDRAGGIAAQHAKRSVCDRRHRDRIEESGERCGRGGRGPRESDRGLVPPAGPARCGGVVRVPSTARGHASQLADRMPSVRGCDEGQARVGRERPVGTVAPTGCMARSCRASVTPLHPATRQSYGPADERTAGVEMLTR
jgi:hypothetical protein